MGDERRRETRFPAIVKVTYESAGAMRAEYSGNISRGGLFVVTDEELEIGQRLELHLACAGARKTIGVPGEVRWIGEKGSPPQRGVGVKFLLEDPVTKARIDTLVSAVFDPLPPSVTGERLNLLLVDPNRHACRLFAEGLQKMAARRFDLDDYFVITDTHDGEAALNYLSSSRIAMAIIELRTPDVDGLELIRRIRTEISQSLPICAMSRPFPGARAQALTSGADMFLEKPVKLKALFNTVAVMLKLISEDATEVAA